MTRRIYLYWAATAADAGWTVRMRERLEGRLVVAGGVFAGEEVERLPDITCVAMSGGEAARLTRTRAA